MVLTSRAVGGVAEAELEMEDQGRLGMDNEGVLRRGWGKTATNYHRDRA